MGKDIDGCGVDWCTPELPKWRMVVGWVQCYHGMGVHELPGWIPILSLSSMKLFPSHEDSAPVPEEDKTWIKDSTQPLLLWWVPIGMKINSDSAVVIQWYEPLMNLFWCALEASMDQNPWVMPLSGKRGHATGCVMAPKIKKKRTKSRLCSCGCATKVPASRVQSGQSWRVCVLQK